MGKVTRMLRELSGTAQFDGKNGDVWRVSTDDGVTFRLEVKPYNLPWRDVVSLDYSEAEAIWRSIQRFSWGS